jgi:hypothetical protein
MFESLLGKFLIIGIVTAVVMAPKYWDAVDRRLRSIRRVWSQ